MYIGNPVVTRLPVEASGEDSDSYYAMAEPSGKKATRLKVREEPGCAA